jgi:hypothetical protein
VKKVNREAREATLGCCEAREGALGYLYTNTKLKNKLKENGIGQYIVEWRE